MPTPAPIQPRPDPAGAPIPGGARQDAERPLPIRRTASPLILLAIGIVVLSFVLLTAHQRTTGPLSERLHLLFWYVDVGREDNLATWFGAGLWLALGVVATVIAAARPVRAGSWWLLAGIALLASVDEYLEIHERFDVPGDRLAAALGLEIGFTWVLLGLPLALLIGLLLVRWVRSLPRRAAIGVLLGGAVFLLGAVAVESLNGLVLESTGGVVDNRFLYGTMVEELLEMSGVSLALAALLSLVLWDPERRSARLDPALFPATSTAHPARES